MDGEAVLAAFAGFEAAREALAGLSVESLTAAQTLTVLQMRERGQEAVLAAFAGFEAAREALAGLSVESLTAAQTLTVLQMRERGHRRDLAIDHALTARLIDQADPHEMGATSIKKLLTERLRITDADAGDRLTDARQLGPKYTLTGERLQSDLPHTADALSRGVIGVAHVRIIQDFVKRLPTWVSFARRDDYERRT
ncbi:13E12 repeat family protein, partial [Mycolicibacterium doricum]|uniref:13E12 repeat family protein n=1 Tax=Mycolicibacterium doricum TaxID=126673 RepID=UPI0021F2EA06